MNDTVSGCAATVAGAASVAAAGPAVPTKATIIAGLKAKVLADIAELESAAGVVLTEAREELAKIDAEAEGFWAKIEAWFDKHL